MTKSLTEFARWELRALDNDGGQVALMEDLGRVWIFFNETINRWIFKVTLGSL